MSCEEDAHLLREHTSIQRCKYNNTTGASLERSEDTFGNPEALHPQVDLHTPNLESATLDWQEKSQNAMMLLPGNMETADVQLTAEGRWLFQCRVSDHVSAGMRVSAKTRCPLSHQPSSAYSLWA